MNIVIGALDRQAGGMDDNSAQANHLVAPALVKRYAKGTDSDATDCLIYQDSEYGVKEYTDAGTLRAGRIPEHQMVYPLARRGRAGGSELEIGEEGTYNALRAGDGGSSRLNQVMIGQGVRRLTPMECERLQGFPDGWTAIPGAPDSRRYAAMGDAVTVPVARFIGERLMRYGAEPHPTLAPAGANEEGAS